MPTICVRPIKHRQENKSQIINQHERKKRVKKSHKLQRILKDPLSARQKGTKERYDASGGTLTVASYKGP